MPTEKKNNPERLNITFEMISLVWAIVSTPMVFETNDVISVGLQKCHDCFISMQNYARIPLTGGQNNK